MNLKRRKKSILVMMTIMNNNIQELIKEAENLMHDFEEDVTLETTTPTDNGKDYSNKERTDINIDTTNGMMNGVFSIDDDDDPLQSNGVSPNIGINGSSGGGCC